MKIALYIEPYKSNHNTFYNNVLLQEEFRKRGFQFDIFTPDVKSKHKNEAKEPFKMSNDLEEFYQIKLYPQFPDPTDYDVLFIYEDNCKNWFKKAGDVRTYIADKFFAKKRTVVCLKFDTIFEYRQLGTLNPIIYGICSDKLTHLARQFEYIVGVNKIRFLMPVIGNLKHTKPNSLTRDELVELYGLDKDRKLIAYLPGKVSKWRAKKYTDGVANFHPNFQTNFHQIQWFYDNFDRIVDYLWSQGYQLVGKLHARDSSKFLTGSSTTSRDDKIKYVDQYHSHELMKYSDFAIIFGTTMVYQLYLYELPAFELGTGIYYPGWAEAGSNKHLELLTPLAQYNYGRELIFGQIVAFNKFKANPEQYLKAFLLNLQNGGYSIKKFGYRKDHPIYGQSFDSSIPKIVDVIINSLKLNP